MLEMFSYGFMVRALMAGVLVGTLLAILSVPVNLKRLSFMGVGVSHSAFGGIAIGAFLGINLTLSALVFSVAVALAIGWFSRRGGVHEDVSTGVVFATSMALGVLFLGFMQGSGIDLFSYLFGSILAVTETDLVMAGIAFLIVTSLFFYLRKEFLVYCFDEEWARVSGVNVERLQDLLHVMIAITIVVSIKLLGIVLVSALLVIPGAIGYMLAHAYKTQYIISIAVALISVLLGLVLSYSFDVASGASIILTASFLFLLSSIFGKRTG
ncbi:Zinc ABC transporter, permease protein ZnuB [hydrothermal vent metagenome]|uniref:Zinc ABC transporter, permease protein ZnuB n=1 Tax=hydrothermal vent metagenome TaxID=652676 RepID=A0A3B1CIQ3_9ZZZZ